MTKPFGVGNYCEATIERPLTFGVNCDRYDRMWVTRCDGTPSYTGCGEEIITSVPYRRATRKRKPSGWLICYGLNDDRTEDRKIMLAFCPSCADHVERWEREHA